LASHVVRLFEGTSDPVELLAVEVPSRSELRVVFQRHDDPARFSIIAREHQFLEGSKLRLAGRTVEEIAFNLVFVGILEPRDAGGQGGSSPEPVWIAVEEWAG
jgi:hypothetical protein